MSREFRKEILGQVKFVVISLLVLVGCAEYSSGEPAELKSPPLAPCNIRVKILEDSYRVSWEDASSDEDGFRVLRYEQNKVTWLAGEVGRGVTELEDTAADMSAEYTYGVVSFNATGQSKVAWEWSDCAYSPAPPGPAPAPPPPPPPAPVPDPIPEPEPDPSPQCCKVCTKGKPCGDSCINANYTCNQPPGCACSVAEDILTQILKQYLND